MLTQTKVTFPALSPLTDRWMHQFLADSTSMRNLFSTYGSPLNILCNEPFVRNYREYAAVMEKHGLEHLVLFARKANKALNFVHAARDEGFGVDTASYRELKQCLDAGFDTHKLVCTAAVKSEELMRLAIAHDVLTVFDNTDELDLAEAIAREMNKPVKAGVRVSGFYFDGHKSYSRFGFDIDTVAELFDSRLRDGLLDFQGFHFHLNGYSVKERASAIADLTTLCVTLKPKGVEVKFIDAGGGLLMNYLADAGQWKAFKEALGAALRGERPPITIDNDGLGLRLQDGEVKGRLDTYPYFNERPRGVFLDEVLSFPTAIGRPGELLRERGIALRIEPGRSLLDGSGITLARVAFRKHDSRGALLVGLEMNGSQCRSASADFLSDPMLLPGDDVKRNTPPVAAYLVGAYCLEGDFILKRRVMLDFMPEIGDVVCFVNTAGYLMHFYERDAHLLGHAPNLVFDPGNPDTRPATGL